jgi:hypothetical protein
VRTDNSGTPQVQKLGLNSGQRVALDSAPPQWSLTDPPPAITYVGAKGPADVIVAFFTESKQLAKRLPALGKRIFPSGVLWICWPRRAGGHESDITSNGVISAVLKLGLVDVKVAAIDNDWSGHKVVWRTTNRNL